MLNKKRLFVQFFNESFDSLVDDRIENTIEGKNNETIYGVVNARICIGPANNLVNSERYTLYDFPGKEYSRLMREGKSFKPRTPFEEYHQRLNICFDAGLIGWGSFNNYINEGTKAPGSTFGYEDSKTEYDRKHRGSVGSLDQNMIRKVLISDPHITMCSGFPPVNWPEQDLKNGIPNIGLNTLNVSVQQIVGPNNECFLPIGFQNRDKRSCAINVAVRFFLGLSKVKPILNVVANSLESKLETNPLTDGYIESSPMVSAILKTISNVDRVTLRNDVRHRSLDVKEVKLAITLCAISEPNFENLGKFKDPTECFHIIVDRLNSELNSTARVGSNIAIDELAMLFKNNYRFEKKCVPHDFNQIQESGFSSDFWFNNLCVPSKNTLDGRTKNHLMHPSIYQDKNGETSQIHLEDLMMMNAQSWEKPVEGHKCPKAKNLHYVRSFSNMMQKSCCYKEKRSYSYNSEYLVLSILRYDKVLTKNGGCKVSMRKFEVVIPNDMLLWQEEICNHYKFVGAICYVGNHYVNLLISDGLYIVIDDEKVFTTTRDDFNERLRSSAVMVSYKKMGEQNPSSTIHHNCVVMASTTMEKKFQQWKEYPFQYQSIVKTDNINSVLEKCIACKNPLRRSARLTNNLSPASIVTEPKSDSKPAAKRKANPVAVNQSVSPKKPKFLGDPWKHNGDAEDRIHDKTKYLQERAAQSRSKDLDINHNNEAKEPKGPNEVIEVPSDGESVQSEYKEGTVFVTNGFELPTANGMVVYYVDPSGEEFVQKTEQLCCFCKDATEKRVGSCTYICDDCEGALSGYVDVLKDGYKKLHQNNNAKPTASLLHCVSCQKKIDQSTQNCHFIGKLVNCEDCVQSDKCKCYYCLIGLGDMISDLKSKYVKSHSLSKCGKPIIDNFLHRELTQEETNLISEAFDTGRYSYLIQKDRKVLHITDYISSVDQREENGTSLTVPFGDMYCRMLSRKLQSYSERPYILEYKENLASIPLATIMNSKFMNPKNNYGHYIIMTHYGSATNPLFLGFHFERIHTDGKKVLLKARCFDPMKKNKGPKVLHRLLNELNAKDPPLSYEFNLIESDYKSWFGQHNSMPNNIGAHTGMACLIWIINILSNQELKIFEPLIPKYYAHLALGILLDEPLYS